MQFPTDELIEDLIQRTQDHLNRVEKLKELSAERLNKKPAPESWSVLECIEHLNRYGDFYIPEFKRRIEKAPRNPSPVFKSGWLGNYFAKSMLPKEKLNKMNTFKSMNPGGSNLDKSVLEKFTRQQKQLLQLLEQARKVNLQKTKTNISISKWIKLRLGDTFRVVVYHNFRHVVQAEKVVKGAVAITA
ncbi:MAG: DinB family protein [Bacteroidetes bacterium]|nr:DinB family protein [Bacteroidota bacterium]